jgi:4-hydroxy-3-methylbut-2-enyl diphosphate reductase
MAFAPRPGAVELRVADHVERAAAVSRGLGWSRYDLIERCAQMNRSVERRRLAVSGVSTGEVVVVSRFVHPRRGPVRCPAASVVAGSMAGSELRIRRAELGSGTGGMLFTVSYLDRDGRAIGIGAAVSLADPLAMNVAREVVDSWSAVLRTRRALVADTGPACVDECGLLAVARMRVREFAARGDAVVQVGPATARLAGTIPVEAVADVDRLVGVDPDQLSFVVAPGTPAEEAAVVLAALRSRFPRLRGQHPDEWCYTASDCREAVRSVAAACDLLLVCGHREAADTRQLVAWAGDTGKRPRQLEDAGELRADWLAPAATVGIVAAPSARPGLLDNVVAALDGLGPLSVARRRVTTEVVGRVSGALRLTHCELPVRARASAS